MTQRNVSPGDLVFIQSRAEINQSLIEEYTAMMAGGVEFDAVEGIEDNNGQMYVWDGHHRGEAARTLDRPLLVNLQPGTRIDAEWLALAANQKHGLRRSRADKQYIVRRALLHPNGVGLSDREVARHCGVDHKTVGKIREEMELSGEIPQIEKRTVTRNGTTYRQDTHSIGSAQQWVPVWQLEQSLLSWLNDTFSNQEAQVQVLEAIHRKTPEGQMYLTRLLTKDILPSPRCKRDVVQACHNLLDQHRQLGKHEREDFQEKREDEALTPLVMGASRPYPPLSYEVERQEFGCPKCREDRVVGVNGSRRWCMHCEATWTTAAEFLAEVTAIRNLSTPSTPRYRVQQRFLDLLPRLDEAQMAQVEKWLDELEHGLLMDNNNGTHSLPELERINGSI